MRAKHYLLLAAIILLAALGIGYHALFATPGGSDTKEQVTVPLGSQDARKIVLDQLEAKGLIRSRAVVSMLLERKVPMETSLVVPPIIAGGYFVSGNMNAWEVARVLRAEPALAWVVVPEGLRKEQIASLLVDALGWNEATKGEFLASTNAAPEEYREGVYFPDTYLIPRDEAPGDVALRMRRRFEEQFAPYAAEAIRQNIRWPTLIKIASIVQREAAGKDDMPLIAGVIWNRLLNDMKLDIDATVQYARDSIRHSAASSRSLGEGGSPEEPRYWSPLAAGGTALESPYNTYLHKGLPPTPISNPGNEAIRAVLFPEETKCFYYLHDSEGGIHCAATYEEHKKNIEKYL